MWNDVKLMDRASTLLFALALLIAAGGAVRLLLESSAFPLRSIRIEGDLHHVGRRDIVNALQGRLSGTFFNMDLDGVRALFESIPWVRHAEVRRLWPDRLEVRLEEQVVLARWGQPEDERLVNVHGEAFHGASDAALPLFAGPADSEREVAEHYDAFRRALAPLALEPAAVVLSPRYSWQVRLSNGLTLQLGRDTDRAGSGAAPGSDLASRLARFVSIYPDRVAPMARRVDYVDLRYPDGFALHVAGLQQGGAASSNAGAGGARAAAARAKAGMGTHDKGRARATVKAGLVKAVKAGGAGRVGESGIKGTERGATDA
jgi:cell division protein FtsQ